MGGIVGRGSIVDAVACCWVGVAVGVSAGVGLSVDLVPCGEVTMGGAAAFRVLFFAMQLR
jgi:hypothetical protein